jgi:ATP-dependent protease ClpP protease subunit
MNIEEIHSRGIDIENRRIYLHGDGPIKDEEPGVDYRMANSFIKNMDILEFQNGEDITVSMTTVGGDWNYGMAIYDRIKACKSHVTIISYSWARSMSSIILQAADRRILMPNCDFMVHYGNTEYNGHYITVKSGMKHEERSEDIMLRIYAEKCINGKFFKLLNTQFREVTDNQENYGIENVMEYIDRQMKDRGDWWMNSEEAVYYGFADEIFKNS